MIQAFLITELVTTIKGIYADPCGLYCKNITIVNDASRVASE
jgi:hypothetical protein